MNEPMRSLLFLPEQGSSQAAAIDALQYFVAVATVLGSVFAAGAVLVLGARGRRRRLRYGQVPRDEPGPRTSRRVEVIAIGSLFGLFMLFWAIGVRQ